MLCWSVREAEKVCRRRRREARVGRALDLALALIVAWSSLTLAFYTDWPVSFWITALGAVAYLASLAVA